MSSCIYVVWYSDEDISQRKATNFHWFLFLCGWNDFFFFCMYTVSFCLYLSPVRYKHKAQEKWLLVYITYSFVFDMYQKGLLSILKCLVFKLHSFYILISQVFREDFGFRWFSSPPLIHPDPIFFFFLSPLILSSLSLCPSQNFW